MTVLLEYIYLLLGVGQAHAHPGFPLAMPLYACVYMHCVNMYYVRTYDPYTYVVFILTMLCIYNENVQQKICVYVCV